MACFVRLKITIRTQNAVNAVFPQDRSSYSVPQQETAEGNHSTGPVGQILHPGDVLPHPRTSGYHQADMSAYIDLTEGGDSGKGVESRGTMATSTRGVASSIDDRTNHIVVLNHGDKQLELTLNSASTVSDVSRL